MDKLQNKHKIPKWKINQLLLIYLVRKKHVSQSENCQHHPLAMVCNDKECDFS